MRRYVVSVQWNRLCDTTPCGYVKKLAGRGLRMEEKVIIAVGTGQSPNGAGGQHSYGIHFATTSRKTQEKVGFIKLAS